MRRCFYASQSCDVGQGHDARIQALLAGQAVHLQQVEPVGGAVKKAAANDRGTVTSSFVEVRELGGTVINRGDCDAPFVFNVDRLLVHIDPLVCP